MSTEPIHASVLRRRLIQHRILARLACEKRVLHAMATMPRTADFVERNDDEVYDLPATD